jgi:hypothetical protein
MGLISRSSHTHEFKHQMGQDRVGYLIELLDRGGLPFDFCVALGWGG